MRSDRKRAPGVRKTTEVRVGSLNTEAKHDLCHPVSHQCSTNKSPSNRAVKSCEMLGLQIRPKITNVKIYHSSHLTFS